MNFFNQLIHGILPFPDAAYTPDAADSVAADQQGATFLNAVPRIVETGRSWDGGAVICWGSNNNPARIVSGFDVLQVSCGCYHTAVLTSSLAFGP